MVTEKTFIVPSEKPSAKVFSFKDKVVISLSFGSSKTCKGSLNNILKYIYFKKIYIVLTRVFHEN